MVYKYLTKQEYGPHEDEILIFGMFSRELTFFGKTTTLLGFELKLKFFQNLKKLCTTL
jgi:hypothetical protein